MECFKNKQVHNILAEWREARRVAFQSGAGLLSVFCCRSTLDVYVLSAVFVGIPLFGN
jgi:hypothetical protein